MWLRTSIMAGFQLILITCFAQPLAYTSKCASCFTAAAASLLFFRFLPTPFTFDCCCCNFTLSIMRTYCIKEACLSAHSCIYFLYFAYKYTSTYVQTRWYKPSTYICMCSITCRYYIRLDFLDYFCTVMTYIGIHAELKQNTHARHQNSAFNPHRTEKNVPH